MEPAYSTNFGGAVLRYGEVAGAIGALESPDNHMLIGMVFPIGRTAEGLAVFRLQVYKADLPGRWVCLNQWFVRGVSRAGAFTATRAGAPTASAAPRGPSTSGPSHAPTRSSVG
jgi:hypothetical protein